MPAPSKLPTIRAPEAGIIKDPKAAPPASPAMPEVAILATFTLESECASLKVFLGVIFIYIDPGIFDKPFFVKGTIKIGWVQVLVFKNDAKKMSNGSNQH
jgi:hypothetical protein